MKLFILSLCALALLPSCETPPATAGPKPDVGVVISSNRATRGSITQARGEIGQTRASLKSSQESSRSGEKHLQNVGADLNGLLSQPEPTPTPSK